MHDQSPAAGFSYCLAINRFFVIFIFFALNALSEIAGFLLYVGGGITVDGVVAAIYFLYFWLFDVSTTVRKCFGSSLNWTKFGQFF